MHMYLNTKVDMNEYFRSELGQFMSGMRRTIAQEIQNRVTQYEV